MHILHDWKVDKLGKMVVYNTYLMYINPNPRMNGESECVSNPLTCLRVSLSVYNLYNKQ